MSKLGSSSLDEKNTIPTSQWIDGVYGLVIKMISNKYCLVQRKGIVNGIFNNLIPNSLYYLKPSMANGGMTSELPKKESIILGKAKSVSQNHSILSESSRIAAIVPTF
ncbi:hypothetical protein D1609_12395 [Leptospira borgpetersenii serovar Hardjo-bovis]|nr:hypothetical protein D1609_12395 [Leptospira borgpetersenii serovar Hardjo-bovis]